MRRNHQSMALFGIVLVFLAPALQAERVTAASAFERLAEMAGTWKGTLEDAGHEATSGSAYETVHEVELSAAGSVVMEVMGPGSGEEMINMYHMDGEDLLLTHYCSSGNQPRMRLDRERSTPNRLVFEFLDGTNLDPAEDEHIHGVEISFGENDRVVSRWTSHAAGKSAGVTSFHMVRAE